MRFRYRGILVKRATWLKRFRGFAFLKTIYIKAEDYDTGLSLEDHQIISKRRWDTLLHHEYIHIRQYKHLTWIGFLLWYGIEWFIKFLYYWNTRKTYYALSLEREAYEMETTFDYERSRFSHVKYIFVKK